MATIFSKNSIVFAHSLQAQMWLIIIKINIYFTLKKFAAFNIFDHSTNILKDMRKIRLIIKLSLFQSVD